MLLFVLFLAGLLTASHFGNASAAKSRLAPTGRLWPKGVDAQSVKGAVDYALATETDYTKLRDFARTLAPFDSFDASRLTSKAAALEAQATGSISLTTIAAAKPIAANTSLGFGVTK